MPSLEIIAWCSSAGGSLILILLGVVWQFLRSEAKEQAEAIKRKADTERVLEVEKRWEIMLNVVKEDGEKQITGVKEDNEKLVDKLSQRHDREIDQLSTRLSEAIKNSEANVLARIELMIQMIHNK